MDFNTLSDPFLRIAFWTGVGSFSLTLVLGAQIVLLHFLLKRSRRREGRAIAKWRPILNATIADRVPKALPILPERDCIIFLNLWVHFHASLRGNACEELNYLGYRLGCDVHARKLLDGGNRAERLLATLVLGYLQDRQAWVGLMLRARQADSTTSFYAVLALVQIDAYPALAELTPDFIHRDDWPVSQVVTMLQNVRDLFEPLLIDALPTLTPVHLQRALRIAEGVRIDLPPALHSEILQGFSVELIIAALRVVTDPSLLGTVRALASHGDWRIRVHVGKALGRIGDSADVDGLKRLLKDPEWWVRYRAAQSLVNSPFFIRQEIDALVTHADDRFSAEMITQVLAEGVTP